MLLILFLGAQIIFLFIGIAAIISRVKNPLIVTLPDGQEVSLREFLLRNRVNQKQSKKDEDNT